jgi:phosphoadenosine phosphosulfate reductase
VRGVSGAAGGFDLEAESARLEAATPEGRLAFALDAFGEGLLFTSSFGAGSGVLLHLWSRVAPGRPVVFVDTGFHFDETLRYRDELARRLGLRLEVAKPPHTMAEFVVEHGPDVNVRDPDFCCARNKVATRARRARRCRSCAASPTGWSRCTRSRR